MTNEKFPEDAPEFVNMCNDFKGFIDKKIRQLEPNLFDSRPFIIILDRGAFYLMETFMRHDPCFSMILEQKHKLRAFRKEPLQYEGFQIYKSDDYIEPVMGEILMMSENSKIAKILLIKAEFELFRIPEETHKEQIMRIYNTHFVETLFKD